MDVKSVEFPDDYLFLSIDISFFRKKEVNFSFLPRHENEARGFVTNIIPFIRHRYPTINIDKAFLKEAIDRHRDSIWNADTNEIVSSADIYLDESSNMVENFNMIEAMGIVINDQKQIPSTKAHERVQQLFLGDDNTSIGTMFTNIQQDVSLCETQYPNRPITPSTNTVRSQGTTLTIEEVDNKLNNLTSDMQKLHQLIYTLIDNRSTSGNLSNVDTTSTPSKVTGEPMDSTCETP